MHHVVGVFSGKGGVGKTVTAINLASAIHGFGKEVTLIDADISSANLTIHLGLPDAIVSLQDVLDKKSNLYKAIRVIPRGLRIVPSSLSLDKCTSDLSRLKHVIKDEMAGLVIIDAPPGFSKDTYSIMEACDDILVVTNPDVPSITDALKVIQIAKRMKKTLLGIVLNRVENTLAEIGARDIEILCEAPIIGVIPEDRAVKLSIFEKTPLVYNTPYSKAAVAYRKLAAKLIGVTYTPPSMIGLRRLFGLLP